MREAAPISFTYTALPAIPSQLQAWDITSKRRGSRLSDFYGCLGDPSLVWGTLMDFILMESKTSLWQIVTDFMWKPCMLASLQAGSARLMCSVAEWMVLQNLFWILGWTDFLLYTHLFLTYFATIPIRGTYTLCLIKLFPESRLFYLLNNHHHISLKELTLWIFYVSKVVMYSNLPFTLGRPQFLLQLRWTTELCEDSCAQ